MGWFSFFRRSESQVEQQVSSEPASDSVEPPVVSLSETRQGQHDGHTTPTGNKKYRLSPTTTKVVTPDGTVRFKHRIQTAKGTVYKTYRYEAGATGSGATKKEKKVRSRKR